MLYCKKWVVTKDIFFVEKGGFFLLEIVYHKNLVIIEKCIFLKILLITKNGIHSEKMINALNGYSTKMFLTKNWLSHKIGLLQKKNVYSKNGLSQIVVYHKDHVCYKNVNHEMNYIPRERFCCYFRAKFDSTCS